MDETTKPPTLTKLTVNAALTSIDVTKSILDTALADLDPEAVAHGAFPASLTSDQIDAFNQVVLAFSALRSKLRILRALAV